MSQAAIQTVHQAVPVRLTAEEAAAKWPSCIVTVVQDGKARSYHGQVVGRSIKDVPTFDVRLKDTNEILPNLPASQVELVRPPRRVA